MFYLFNFFFLVQKEKALLYQIVYTFGVYTRMFFFQLLDIHYNSSFSFQTTYLSPTLFFLTIFHRVFFITRKYIFIIYQFYYILLYKLYFQCYTPISVLTKVILNVKISRRQKAWPLKSVEECEELAAAVVGFFPPVDLQFSV